MCRISLFLSSSRSLGGGRPLARYKQIAVLYIGFSLRLCRSLISRVARYTPASRVPLARHILCDNPAIQQKKGGKDTLFFSHICKRKSIFHYFSAILSVTCQFLSAFLVWHSICLYFGKLVRLTRLAQLTRINKYKLLKLTYNGKNYWYRLRNN